MRSRGSALNALGREAEERLILPNTFAGRRKRFPFIIGDGKSKNSEGLRICRVGMRRGRVALTCGKRKVPNAETGRNGVSNTMSVGAPWKAMGRGAGGAQRTALGRRHIVYDGRRDLGLGLLKGGNCNQQRDTGGNFSSPVRSVSLDVTGNEVCRESDSRESEN